MTSRENGSNPQWGDPCHPLTAAGHYPVVAIKTDQANANGTPFSEELAHTIDCAGPEAIACTQYGDVAGALTARYDSSPCSDRGANIVCMADTQANTAIESDLCGSVTVHTAKDAPVVCVMGDKGNEPIDEEVAGTLTRQTSEHNAVASGSVVRRLTPLECERLQGFPDGYTDIGGAADGPRYRALGNSMAVPVMRWIGERIAAIDAIDQGYGGSVMPKLRCPLCYEEVEPIGHRCPAGNYQVEIESACGLSLCYEGDDEHKIKDQIVQDWERLGEAVSQWRE